MSYTCITRKCGTVCTRVLVVFCNGYNHLNAYVKRKVLYRNGGGGNADESPSDGGGPGEDGPCVVTSSCSSCPFLPCSRSFRACSSHSSISPRAQACAQAFANGSFMLAHGMGVLRITPSPSVVAPTRQIRTEPSSDAEATHTPSGLT